MLFFLSDPALTPPPPQLLVVGPLKRVLTLICLKLCFITSPQFLTILSIHENVRHCAIVMILGVRIRLDIKKDPDIVLVWTPGSESKILFKYVAIKRPLTL